MLGQIRFTAYFDVSPAFILIRKQVDIQPVPFRHCSESVQVSVRISSKRSQIALGKRTKVDPESMINFLAFLGSGLQRVQPLTLIEEISLMVLPAPSNVMLTTGTSGSWQAFCLLKNRMEPPFCARHIEYNFYVQFPLCFQYRWLKQLFLLAVLNPRIPLASILALVLTKFTKPMTVLIAQLRSASNPTMSLTILPDQVVPSLNQLLNKHYVAFFVLQYEVSQSYSPYFRQIEYTFKGSLDSAFSRVIVPDHPITFTIATFICFDQQVIAACIQQQRLLLWGPPYVHLQGVVALTEIAIEFDILSRQSD